MAVHMTHFINNEEIYPQNGDDIGIKINFSDEAEGATVNELNVDSIILVNRAKEIVENHIATGGGVFQGIPYKVVIDSVTIDMFIDLTQNPKISGEGDGAIEVKIKKRKSWSQFKENADVLSFEAVNTTHPINVIDIPYVIVPDNQGAAFISAFIGTMVLGKALKESVMELAKGIGEVTSSLIPNTGASVGIGAGAVTILLKPGEIILAALKLALRIAYFIVIMFLFINMVNKMLQIISPSVQKLKGSTILELLTKGCVKLGYTFQSSIITADFQNTLTLVPVPLVDDNISIWQQSFFSSFISSHNKGYPTASDTTPTLGALIDAMIKMFNGKILVNNGVVTLERRDFLLNISARRVTNTLNLQGKRANQWTFNTGDAWKRYWIHYQVDHSDIHSVDNMNGIHAEYSTDPISIVALDLVNIKGLSDVSIPFALASRKGQPTVLETTFKTLANAVNAAESIFGGGGSTNLMTSSVGVMKISQQHFGTTKLLYNVGNGKQSTNYLSKLSSTLLWEKYHSINEVKRNFKRIYSASIPFSSKDMVALQGNNYIYDTDNNLLEILSFEWLNQTKTAEIEFAIESTEENNTRTIKIR